MIDGSITIKKDKPSSHALLAWYDVHRRIFPWRALPDVQTDPYAVWLSEIMLQQTNVTTVKPYFERFLARWPKVDNLAGAPVEEVMKQWAGLGYYSRARNLHLCAKQVVSEFAGHFPANEADLLKLPGIGAYTAAAITSIAFDTRAVVVDGNVERVISRLNAIETPLPAAKTAIKAFADQLTPDLRAGDFAQAMMDLGATICTPRNPACGLCPFSVVCKAQLLGTQEKFPVKAPKLARPLRGGAAFVLRREDGAILVRRRPPKGLLGGMLEVPTTDWSSNARANLYGVDAALSFAPLKACWQCIGAVEHIFTHFSLRLNVYAAQAAMNAVTPAGSHWALESELAGEAFPSLFRKVLGVAIRN